MRGSTPQRMSFLDVPTVLQVSAVFNLMAALAWLVLAQLFRIAPRASRLMAAAHIVRIGSPGCIDCLAGWPAPLRQALPEFGLLLTMVLLLLALRPMMRSRQRPYDIAWLAGAGALFMLAGLAQGSLRIVQVAAATSACALAVLAVRDIVRGVGGQLSRPITVGMALPFCLLVVFSGLLALRLATGTGWVSEAFRGDVMDVRRAVLGLLTTVCITLSLLALMIWRLISRIQHLTYRDPLTGALNRRAFELALGEAQALLQRGRGFAVAMIDIDHFKRVNDEHGHPAGDAALQHCVQVLQAGLRDVDRLGRLGGEEFCVLLPLGAPGEVATAAAVAERLRSQLAAKPLRWKGVELQLTASFGVGLPVVGDVRGEVCLARADAELYRAKAEGRNRVCVWAPLSAAS